MSHLLYLICLTIPLGCLALIDHRLQLAFWYNRRAAALTVACTVGLFLVWDSLGVNLGIFFSASDQYLTGLQIYPNIPLEEIFFLTLLGYTTLLAYQLVVRRRR